MSRPPSPTGEPPTGPATHSSGGVKFNPPAVFDGSFKDYKRFMRELIIFLTGYKINDDATKIAIALSYMRGGYADEFVQETVNLASTDPTALNWGTWTNFLARLNARFKDKNFAQTAREKLEHFQQGKNLIDTYIAHLESLFTDAGLIAMASANPADPVAIIANTAINNEKIRILEKSVGSNILETIYSSDNPIPTTYDAYKEKILQLGRMRERYRQFRNITSPTSSSSTTHAPKPPAQPAPQFHTHIHPSADKKTGTGITYGGAGQPMEIGKTRQQIRCFNCGELGHMRRECPKEKNVDIRH
jgi:Arginine methyltransferase-interacting protein, contains RING Zn-finger